MNRFSYVDCTTVGQALDQMSPEATVKAGGIDLLDLMKDGIVAPPRVVNIRNVASLRGITSTPKGLQLGPLSTLTEISEHPEIQKSYSALCGCCGACGDTAGPQHGDGGREHHAEAAVLVLPVDRL